MKNNITIGFIGQGFVGKNYADDFEERGYNIVRYDIESYKENKDKIKGCDITLIAVPTPTTKKGFDCSIINDVLNLIGDNNIAIIKSTIKIGTTKELQSKHPNIIIMHSPEFLVERTAAHNARNPKRNIIGITNPNDNELYKKAELVMSTLPKADYNLITKVENAEIIKYGGNCLLYTRVVFINMFHDLILKYPELDFKTITSAMAADPRIGGTHLSVSHQGGRGAGGHCFIKDFEAFIEMFEENNLNSQKGTCEAIRNINLKYLKESNKDLDLIRGVYGE
jgi:UDPglucose 6-dehydrogenase